MKFKSEVGSGGPFELEYDDLGPKDGSVVVLVHGFSANRQEGWGRTGWFEAFSRRGARVLALDLRGHGQSARSHDPADYAQTAMADDIIALMDQAGVTRADVIGFSLGARLALLTTLRHADRVDRLILAGVGARLLEPSAQVGLMAQAMEADDPDAIAHPLLKGFRQFADAQGEDRLALAACSRGAAFSFAAEDLERVLSPTLVVAGARDALAGPPQGLADRIPGARAVTLPGCDHFATPTHALFKGACFDFLDGWLDAEEMPGFE